MARVARCPHCKKLLIGIEKTPSQLKRQAEIDAAADRRQAREAEVEIRRWYTADFKIIYDAVERTKMNQAQGKPISQVLFQSILAAHENRIEALEQEIRDKVRKKLAKK